MFMSPALIGCKTLHAGFKIAYMTSITPIFHVMHTPTFALVHHQNGKLPT